MTPPVVRCSQCNQPMDRDERKKRPFWVCGNLYCKKNRKPGKFINGIRVW